MKKNMGMFSYNNVTYEVIITKKFIKNTYFRFKNGKFYINAPFLSSNDKLIKLLESYATKLIRTPKIDMINKCIYVFGEKCISSSNIFNIFNNDFLILNSDDFYKKIKPYFLNYIIERVRYFEKLMNVTPFYNVRVKKMSTRLGSNSKKTHTLNFALSLIHYSKEAIDSVVIHELAHHFYFDHSKNFYNLIYKYCPNYDKLNKEFKSK